MRAGRDRLAGAGLAVLLAGAVLAGPAGCKNKAAEMSRYPYFLTTLNERWEIARASLGSDKPDISYVVVLLKDMDGAAEALEWSYHGSNRDQAIAKLKDVAAKFRDDLSDKVDLRTPEVRLLPGATAKDVAGAVERAHQDYLQFQPMVALK